MSGARVQRGQRADDLIARPPRYTAPLTRRCSPGAALPLSASGPREASEWEAEFEERGRLML